MLLTSHWQKIYALIFVNRHLGHTAFLASVDPQAKDISHLLAFTCQPERHDELLTLANEVMVKRLAKGISEQELNEYQQNVQRSLDIQQRSVQQLANTIVNSLIQYDDPAAWIEQEQLLKQMTVENVNTAVKQYLSHPVNTYTGVLLPKYHSPVNTSLAGILSIFAIFM